MKKFVLSVMSTLLSTVLLVGCTPQPTVSTDAPATTETATTTPAITTTAASTTTTPATTTTTTTTTVITTTTTTNMSAPATTTKKTTSKKNTPAEYAIRFEKDTSVGWQCIFVEKAGAKNDFDEPDSAYIVDGQAEIYLNGKWISLKKAINNDPLVLTKAFYAAQHYSAKKRTAPKDFVMCRQLAGPGFSYAEFANYKVGYWFIWDECPKHPYTKTDEKERTDFAKTHPSFRKTVFIVCPSSYSMALEDLDICFEDLGTITKKVTTTTAIKFPREYSVKFKRDDSIGWKQLYKRKGNIPSSYIVGGTAKVYIKGKWIPIEKAIKKDPEVLKKIYENAWYDNLTLGDRIKRYKVRGPDLWYTEYTDFKIGFWWMCEENSCPVHPRPRWEGKFDNLTEKEQEQLNQVIEEELEYNRVHSKAQWYVLFPSDTPHLTGEDVYDLGICFADM